MTRPGFYFGKNKPKNGHNRDVQGVTRPPKTVPKTPMVHCVMPTTTKRRWCVERAIRCWLNQDYPLDRRRLVVIDGPNETGSVRDLVPRHPRITYISLIAGEPGSPGDKYNLGINLADDGDWIALWADDDWHHPQRISFVVDAMVQAGVEIGGTVSMFNYRTTDKKLHLFAHPYVIQPAKGADASRQETDLTLPYLIGGTMIFPKRRWREVGQFKPLKRGTDSEFVHRLCLGREEWDLDGIRIDPDFGDKCSVTTVLTLQFGRVVYDSALVQLAEPRLYCAIVHGDNTGNPTSRGHQGGEGDTFAPAGEQEMAVLRRRMGAEAEEFLGAG